MEQIITPAGSKKLARASGRKQKLSIEIILLFSSRFWPQMAGKSPPEGLCRQNKYFRRERHFRAMRKLMESTMLV